MKIFDAKDNRKYDSKIYPSLWCNIGKDTWINYATGPVDELEKSKKFHDIPNYEMNWKILELGMLPI